MQLLSHTSSPHHRIRRLADSLKKNISNIILSTTCPQWLRSDVAMMRLMQSAQIKPSNTILTNEKLEARLLLNPLFDYAARYWGHHVREALIEREQLVLQFLQNELKVAAAIQAMLAARDSDFFGYSQRVPTNLTGIHLSAHFGLYNAMQALIDEGYYPDLPDSHGRTPLSWAAINGHESIVQLLLNEDVDADFSDANGQTPLSWAAEHGHDSIVEMLLVRKGVNPNSKDKEYGQTPLWWALEKGHEPVVKLLLTRDAVDPNSANVDGQTPLWWALDNGSERLIGLLLASNNIDLSIKNEDGQTPLLWALEERHEMIIKLLLTSSHTDVHAKNKHGQTPIIWATQNGHEAVVKLLLEWNADPNSKDQYSQTPLFGQHEMVIKQWSSSCRRRRVRQHGGIAHDVLFDIFYAITL